MALDLNEFITDVYQNAVDHGWHETERNPAEIFSLIHSELSEALEEYRCHRGNVWYGENGKPEGIAIELLDAVIRIFDYFGSIGVTLPKNTINELVKTIKCGWKFAWLHEDSFPVYLCEVHSCISKAYQARFDGLSGIGYLVGAVSLIFKWLREEEFDTEKYLIEKHEYNKSRGWKHGGKAC